ncbi:serine hydroxymethyltransferase, partial [Planctomycetota bacterium]
GDKILSLGLDQGGHVSHGADVSFSGKFFDADSYSVSEESLLLDYEAIRTKAAVIKPKLIICGASAYSRTIDFRKFREIADSVGAYLMADISHIAGLIIAGAHPSVVDYAHFTTTSTYKPGGPRGGLILMGKDYDRVMSINGREIPLWRHLDKTTFPGVQGTPYLNNIAAKAVFFKETLTDKYRARQFNIIENAKRLANNLADLGYDILTGGTDNHMVLINIAHLRQGMTGLIAQKSLEDCGIIINMNRLPYDKKNMKVTSGIRLGTPVVTRNGMGAEEMDNIPVLIDAVLRGITIISDSQYRIEESLKNKVNDKVRLLCTRFPMR